MKWLLSILFAAVCCGQHLVLPPQGASWQLLVMPDTTPPFYALGIDRHTSFSVTNKDAVWYAWWAPPSNAVFSWSEDLVTWTEVGRLTNGWDALHLVVWPKSNRPGMFFRVKPE
jgi:hypothetical protein